MDRHTNWLRVWLFLLSMLAAAAFLSLGELFRQPTNMSSETTHDSCTIHPHHQRNEL